MKMHDPAAADTRRRASWLPKFSRCTTKSRACLCAAFVCLIAPAAVLLVPLPAALDHPPPPALELTDRRGAILREILDDESRYAQPIPLEQIPKALVSATLAAEDKRFFSHHGIDPLAVARALRDALRHRRFVSGGSTITQQLVKISAASARARTPSTKFVESLQAIKLDLLWNKDRILHAYLNRLDYGNLRIGCNAAARFYFDKPIADLSLAEAAQLAALPRSPSRLNPLRHPVAAREARELVLGRMLRNNAVTMAEYLRAVAEPAEPGVRRHAFRAPHFADLALARTGARTGPTPTTLDLDLNSFVEERLHARVAALAAHRVSNGAAVVIDNRTAELLALVGSENYFQPGSGQVNAAIARRSAGSSLKPFTCLLALERGWTPASLVPDIPSEYPTETGMFRPVNFDRTFRGPVRLRIALANSLNVPAVRLLHALGGPTTLAKALKDCGLSSIDRPPADYGLGLTIGNAEVRLLELANAYATLARLGVYKSLRLYSDEPEDPGRPVFNPAAAWLIADILSDDFARAPAFGVRSSLSFAFPVACKTGTSSSFRDNWAFGYTPEFTVAVWIGNFDGSPMQNVSGVTGAAPLLRDIFRHLRQTRGTTWFPKPPDIIAARIHPLSGKRLTDGSAPGLSEFFVADNLPPIQSPDDTDPLGRVRLGPEYSRWLAEFQNPLFAPPNPAATPLAILSPATGSTFFLDPDLPGSHLLPLRAALPAQWHSPTLTIESTQNGPAARLTPGRHQIVALDPASRRQATSWIQVLRR